MASTSHGPDELRGHARYVDAGGVTVQNGSALHHHHVAELPISDLHIAPHHCNPAPCSISPAHCAAHHFFCNNNYSDQDSHSLTSQDSGIPTLEIHPPEILVHNLQSTNHDSPATLALDDSSSLHKSSTFPRSGFDSVRLFSPAIRLSTNTASGALNRSDDISVCSVSSMSTELSVSNEDILDFTVTSDSSAIVTLETDNSGAAHFSDVTLTSSPESACSPVRPEKKPGPLASLFNRSLFARRVKDTRTVEQRDPGWKLFGKVPPREGPIKDPKKIQKEYETKSGRAGASNPTSPRQSVRKNLDFEPLSTTALILEDRPANLPAKPAEEAQKHRQQYEEMVALAKKRELKEAQKRRKQLEDRCKLEESIGSAAQTWTQEILPNWSAL